MKKIRQTSLIALLGGAISMVSSQAADLTWRGTAGNWTAGNAWVNETGANTTFSTAVTTNNVWLTDAGLGQPAITIGATAVTLGTMTANTAGFYDITVAGAGSLTGSSLILDNSGTLSFGNTGAVSFANTSLTNGTLIIRQTAFSGGAINVSGNATIAGATAATTTLNGTSLIGAGELTLAPNGGSRITLASSLDTSAFTGKLKASAAGQINLIGASTNLSQAKVELSGDSVLQSLSDGVVQIGEITAGSGNKLGKGTNSVTAATYEIGALNSASSIAGGIQNGGTTTGGAAATGTVAVAKVGTGTLSLTGANTYTGATTVNAGTLLLGNGISGSTVSATTVNTGAFYGNLATGNITTAAVVIGNNLGIADAAFGAGENVIGRFASSSSLTLNSDANFIFDINSSSGATDTVSFGGTVTLSGLFTLNDINIGAVNWNVDDSFTVLSGSSLTGTFGNLADGGTISAHGITYLADYNGTALTLTVTAVPEPATGLLVAGGIGLALFIRRRLS